MSDKIKAIIIDDEQHCIESLEIELQNHCPNVEVISKATSAIEGAELIKNLNPDLVFLDVEMPWINGFELLEKLEKINFDVIFVTGYDQYAIKAFKFSAIDYLLKPVSSDELITAVCKVRTSVNSFNDEHLSLLLANIKGPQNNFSKIALPTAESIEYVAVNDIIRCESNGNYCSVYLTNGKKIFLAKTLKNMESLLVDQKFIRVHNSHLISEQHISRYVKTDGGEIEMIDGSKIPISRSKKNEFLNRNK